MITIDEIKLIDIKIPFKQVFHSSQDRYPSKSTILLQIKTKEGHNTWSECVALETPSYLPETKEQAWKCLQSTLIPKILSKPFESAESASQFINTITPGHEMAKASLEMGIWALFALQEEVSLSEFLGGKKTEIPCGLAIGIQENTDALITTVQKAIENDYHSLKLKLSPSTAIATLTCIRKEFGKELSLTGDANCSYEKHKIEEIKNLDNFSLAYLEQPLARNNLLGHQELSKTLKTPIRLDESIQTKQNLEQMISLNAGKSLSLKPGRVGGFYNSLNMIKNCQENKISLCCGGMFETGIGRAYTLALSSLEAITEVGDMVPSGHYFEKDLIEPEWKHSEKGFITVPRTSPGLGIRINEKLIDKLSVRSERFSN